MLEPKECTPIQSEHPDFSADICFSPYTCNEGLVRVRRKDREICKQSNLRYPISNNATHDSFHRQFSGPDSFYVVFSGAEKLSPPDWYTSNPCLYVFPFHISNPGRFSLDITHLYDNYSAVVEQTNEWPDLKQKNVVSNLPIEVCRGCQSQVAQPRFPELDSEVPPSQEQSTSMGLARESKLPLCSRKYAIQGAWLPAHPIDRNSWRKAQYTWTPLGCTLGKPLERKCLLRKKDSLKVLLQVASATSKLEETLGSTTFTYIYDPLSSGAVKKTDVVVANMGQMATGTSKLDRLMSTSEFHDRIQHLVSTIQQHVRDVEDLDDEADFVDSEYYERRTSGNTNKYNSDEDSAEFEDEMEKVAQRYDNQYKPNRSEDMSNNGDRKENSKPHHQNHDPKIVQDLVSEKSQPVAQKSTKNTNAKTKGNKGAASVVPSRPNKPQDKKRRLSRRSITHSSIPDPESDVRLIWAGMVAHPEILPTDSFLRNDWRTIYRLRYWNQITEDVMLLNGTPFMDFFTMTLSMLDTSLDRSHYIGNDAAEAMLEELAFKLGLCEDSG
ncbi:hypothetical protein BGZ76_006651 [Entomortierella beljakovae]|nr:hypothetical protein BGZ76_006651 [Entomortierella beljakovae]